MAKDAITMFKEAAAQMQREEIFQALMGTLKQNDEDEVLQSLIGDFNLAREAKAEMEQLVEYVNAIVNTAVNGGDPMTVEQPPQGGCSGNCSSCAGCH